MVKITIGSAEYDSYISVDGADEYLAADIARAGAWATRNADTKARALVSSTRMMVDLPWCDAVPGFDDAASPVPEVTAMLAADLAAKPALFADASGNSNIKVAKAGSASVEFFSPVSGGAPIPKALWDKLNAAGLVCLPSNGVDGQLPNDGAIVTGADGCRPTWGRYPWDWPIASEDYD